MLTHQLLQDWILMKPLSLMISSWLLGLLKPGLFCLDESSSGFILWTGQMAKFLKLHTDLQSRFTFSGSSLVGIIDTPISTLLTLEEIYNNSVTVVGPSAVWFDFITWGYKGNNSRPCLSLRDQKGSRPQHNVETGCQYQWVMLQQIMQRSIFVLMAVNLSILHLLIMVITLSVIVP